MTSRLRLGTQGWNYDAWVGPFYPPGTRPAEYLTVYARAFETVEVDSTFYAIPPIKTVRGWYDRTPPGFTFALKLPQEITHERRLRATYRGDPLLLRHQVDLSNWKLDPVVAAEAFASVNAANARRIPFAAPRAPQTAGGARSGTPRNAP